VAPCQSGEFPCPNGFECQQGFCFPISCNGVVCEPGEVCEWCVYRCRWWWRARRNGW
jgi:hypothetical protein